MLVSFAVWFLQKRMFLYSLLCCNNLDEKCKKRAKESFVVCKRSSSHRLITFCKFSAEIFNIFGSEKSQVNFLSRLGNGFCLNSYLCKTFRLDSWFTSANRLCVSPLFSFHEIIFLDRNRKFPISFISTTKPFKFLNIFNWRSFKREKIACVWYVWSILNCERGRIKRAEDLIAQISNWMRKINCQQFNCRSRGSKWDFESD